MNLLDVDMSRANALEGNSCLHGIVKERVWTGGSANSRCLYSYAAWTGGSAGGELDEYKGLTDGQQCYSEMTDSPKNVSKICTCQRNVPDHAENTIRRGQM